MKSYDFKEQLNKASQDELRLLWILNLIKYDKNLNIGFLEPKGYPADARDVFHNINWEFKIDYYKNTGNHFVERWSSMEDKSPGGVWQYLDKAEYYVFYYQKYQHIHIFKTEELLNKMEELIELSNKIKGVEVKQRNGKYTTYGYKVPKKLVEEISITIDLNDNDYLNKKIESLLKNDIKTFTRGKFSKASLQGKTLSELFNEKSTNKMMKESAIKNHYNSWKSFNEYYSCKNYLKI